MCRRKLMELALFNDGNDPGRVLSLMHFPSSDEARRQFFVRHIVKKACDDGAAEAEVSLSTALLKDLIEGPGLLEMKAMTEEAVKKGSVAGDLLHLIYEMHARGLEEPSFGKALKEYQAFALGGKYGDGEALKYSEQTLRNFFSEYMPVAHLWAAFRLNRGPYAYAEHPQDVFASSDMFRTFLGVAKGIGEFATTFIPKRTKPPKPVIDPLALVQIPGEIPSVRLSFRATG
jgi:hypothetical protein